MSLKPVYVRASTIVVEPREEKYILTPEMEEEMVRDYLKKKGVLCDSAEIRIYHKDRHAYYDFEIVDGERIYDYTGVTVTWK